MTKIKKPPTDAEINANIAQARSRPKTPASTPSPEHSTATVDRETPTTQASRVLALIHANNLPGFGATVENADQRDEREAAEIVALGQRVGMKWAQ